MDLNKKIRFGVMVDGDTVEQWQFDTIKLLIDNGIELALVIKNGDESKPYKSFWDKIFHYPYSRLLFRIWHRYFFKPDAKHPTSFRPQRSEVETRAKRELSPLVKKSPALNYQKITVKPIIKGISTYFSDEDIAKIKSYDLDLFCVSVSTSFGARS